MLHLKFVVVITIAGINLRPFSGDKEGKQGVFVSLVNDPVLEDKITANSSVITINGTVPQCTSLETMAPQNLRLSERHKRIDERCLCADQSSFDSSWTEQGVSSILDVTFHGSCSL